VRAAAGGGSLTEETLVAAIRAAAEQPAGHGSPRSASLVVGIGDDAAAWRPSRSNLSVITTDALVDGVHFLRDRMDASAIGERAMASNISDIAAMGARPRLATIALGFPADVDETWIVACYRGMAAVCARFGATIAGGDIVRAPAITLAITVVGEVSPTHMKRRDGGRPGDVLAVTGALGASRAGLELTLRPELRAEVEPGESALALAAFERPQPRVREGRWLAASRYVHAMMDLSDGLSTDAPRLARASGCGLTLDEVPVHLAAAAVAETANADPIAYARDGGEDFELLVAIAPRAFDYLSQRYALRFGVPLLRVGRLDREPGQRFLDDGTLRELVASGYDHLLTGRRPLAER
jgi:thiamine-monophosphate kinase